MTIEQSIEQFLGHIANERRLSPNTVTTYRNALECFQTYATNQKLTEVGEVDARVIRSWQMDLMANHHAARTTNKMISALHSWSRYLRRQGLMETDPFQKVTSVKTDKHLPIFFKENEVERIYSAELFPDTFDGQRDRLLLRILYETGIRCSEAVGLKEASVDMASRQIKVLGKRNKERIIPIENELAQNIQRFVALKNQNGIETDALLPDEKGRPLTSPKVYQIVHKYMSLVSNAERVSPHIFRHTFATHLLNEGANIDAVKELLGHTDLMATEVYTHVTREHLKEAYKHAHPRAGQKKN